MRLSLILLFALLPGPVLAHAARQAFVLLLPTGHYLLAGVAAVALTVAAVAAMPPGMTRGLFCPRWLGPVRTSRHKRREGWSLAAAAMLLVLVALGLAGSGDPTRNALPLAVWTLFWICLVLAQVVAGGLWRRVDPWSGPLHLLRRAGLRPVARLPGRLGHWPALASLLAFAYLLLVHPRASDPDVLAVWVLGYWLVHLGLAAALGPRWLRRGEVFGLLMTAYAGLAPLARWRGRLGLGLPGWRAMACPAPATGLAVLMVALLALGSFDGLNETFAWLGLIGQNPLEFAGRSAVIWPTLAGVVLAVPLLAGVFAGCLWLGLRLARSDLPLGQVFRAQAPALLPIALAYHLAHYLPGLLIEIQALPNVLTDPLGHGADWLGWGHRPVTTGFFNRLGTVRVLWLVQAGAVVAGHVLAIGMSHAIALRQMGSARAAASGQAPVALFMVGYTLFGLWLLASPQV